MTKRIPLLLLLLLAFAASTPAASAAYTPDYSAYFNAADTHWGPGACTGRYELQWGDLSGQGDAAEATGIQVGLDGTILPDGTQADDASWTLTSCVITIDAKYWSIINQSEQCAIIVHEVGHLNMHRHAEGGVMSADHSGYVPECDFRSPRQRAVDEVTDRLLQEPGDFGVAFRCGKMHGRTFYCRFSDNMDRDRRFKIRLRAPYYNITEVKISS